MDISPASTNASSTVITNLSDDCLLEVFEHLALTDLCATADVCRRFRANARARVASVTSGNDALRIEFSYGHGKILPQARSESLDKARVKPGDLPIQKVLLFFGNMVQFVRIESDSTISGLKFAKNVLDGISFHCKGTLIDLDLIGCAIDVEVELAARPLLSNLQILSLRNSECGESIGEMLSLCSSLRELQFLHPRTRVHCSEGRFDDILRQSFPRLELISFRNVSSVKNIDIEEFLKLNPQLRKIEVLNCENIDGTIFLSIARHTPSIETIHIDAVTQRIRDKNLQYFSKLDSLSTLKLNLADQRLRIVDKAFMSSILEEICEAQIPLQHLHINAPHFSELCNLRKLVYAIAELNTLKTLWLIGVPKLTIPQAAYLCEKLDRLSELILILRLKTISPSTVAHYVEIAELHYTNRLVFKVNYCDPFDEIPENLRLYYEDKLELQTISEDTIPSFYCSDRTSTDSML